MKKACISALLALPLIIQSGQAPLYSADKTKSPSVQNKKVLVVYYSRTGNTKKVALDIAKQLDADTEELIDKKDRSGAGGYLVGGKDAFRENLTDLEPVKKDPSQYELVVIGTPIWSWDMSPAVRTYITAHKNSFRSVAFFLTAGGTGAEKIVKKLEALSAKKSVFSAGFVESELETKNQKNYDEKISKIIADYKKPIK